MLYKSWSLASLLGALALCACAGAAPGVMSGNEPTYIESVDGTTGRPITLKIDVDRVHFKNALRALTIGDDNQAKARVAVFDRPTGAQLASFDVSANADASGDLAVSIGIGVAGAFDPTGIVDIVGAIGSAASADINRSGTATAMRANLAAETLRQTFGDTRTRAVTTARQNQTRQPGPANTPGQ